MATSFSKIPSQDFFDPPLLRTGFFPLDSANQPSDCTQCSLAQSRDIQVD